jgi:hypothetical protein
MVKNKQLFLRCEQLRTETTKIDSSSLDSAINDLLCDVVALRNGNRQNLLRARSILSEYKEEKPAVEENHVNVVQHNKKL